MDASSLGRPPDPAHEPGTAGAPSRGHAGPGSAAPDGTGGHDAPRRLRRLVGALPRAFVLAGLGALVCAASIALALIVTPASTVSAAGQTVSVGAAAPTLSLSGPGELDLFGQKIPTTLQFHGPVRPRLVLQRITVDSQVATLFGASRRPAVTRSLGQALASGWTRYFVWEALITGACALALIGALAGWWRLPWRRVLLLLGAGLVVVEAVDLGAVMFAAYGAPARLSKVGSLESLVGRATLTIAAAHAPTTPSPVDAVVLGDSTAAGLGNPPVANPTSADRSCGRSADSYARDLAQANGWTVLNLACSGATVTTGLLGPQQVGDGTLPSQVAVAKGEKHLSAVFVSIGANDVDWSGLLEACAATTSCGNSAFAAYFQQQLAQFSTSYLQLLQQLAQLRGHPTVVVNLYYNPFDPAQHCLARDGLTPAKERAVGAYVDALDGVLAEGAAGSSFVAVQPPFAGHVLCDPQPYLQGLHGAAPFHPTASGELAIALADEQAVLSHRGRTATASPGLGGTATSAPQGGGQQAQSGSP